MLKQQSRLLSRIAMTIDTLMIVAAFFAAYWVVRHFTRLNGLWHYHWILFVQTPLWLLLLRQFNLYASLRTKGFLELINNIAKVHIVGALLVSSTIFVLDPRGFSRLLFGGCIVLSFILISSGKASIKLWLHFLRRRGYNFRYLMLAGCTEVAGEMIKQIKQHPEWGYKLIGIARDGSCHDTAFQGVPIIATIEDIISYSEKHPLDEVIWCLEHGTAEQENIYYHMLKMGITFRTILDYSIRPTKRVELTLLNGQFQLLTFYGKEFNADQLLMKRCLDIVGSLVGLAVTAALFPFIALSIRLDSPGPILFCQTRVGENGRTFRCWKFRSMFVDAEARKQALMAQNEMQGAMFKIKDDPRVTRVGKFIRKTSIDELPQFWNVLRGDMSLVGTRPPTPEEVRNYKHWQHKRICIKPGITGLWQVSGRNEIRDFDQVADLDINYIDKWDLWLDIKILFKTVWVVFARSGAS